MEVVDNVRTGRYLSREQRQAIAASVASGRSQKTVAQEFNVTPMTVSRIMREVRNASQTLQGDWRTQQTTAAIRAVNKGLAFDEDPYKGADLGVKVLTGLQVYKPSESGSTTNNIFVNIEHLPSDWYQHARFANPDDAPVIDVEATPDAGSSDTPKP